MAQVLDQDQFESKISSKYTDVVGAKLGGEIVACSNEFFAEASNLIQPGNAIQDLSRFVPTGKWYDGWETRRHNTEEADWVVIKLGVALARLIGCEVDTAFFKGNHAPHISVEAVRLTEDEAEKSDPLKWAWEAVIDKHECGPSARHFFALSEETKDNFTHVRLRMYPDGGIARFRLYGLVVFDPEAVQAATEKLGSSVLDVAAAVHGGVVVGASNQNFSPASNILLPGRGHDMLDGWETLRLRAPGHVDYAEVKLGAPAKIERVVVDTANFIGNFPQYIDIRAVNAKDGKLPPHSEWDLIVPKSKTLADIEHEFAVDGKKTYTHALLTMIPDGGVKRFKVFGVVDQ